MDERSTDLYGYRVSESGQAKAGWQVLAVRFTDPHGPYGGFLEALGMQRRGGASAHFAAYGFSGGAHGAVGLHPPTDKAGPYLDEAGAIRLSFETTEPLAAVAARLEGDRVPVLQRQEAVGPVLEISDPDGIAVEVFAAPEGSA